MRELDLHTAHSFFDSKDKHDAWIHPGTKQKYQPYHFLIPSKQLKRTTDVNRKFDGVPSDHAALMISFKLHYSKLAHYKKNNNAIVRRVLKVDNNYLRLAGNATFIEKIPDFINKLTKENKNENEDA